MILINGAPGTGKSTLADAIYAQGNFALFCTDMYMRYDHNRRINRILQYVKLNLDNRGWPIVVEGCEVDRIIKHYLEERLDAKYKNMLQGALLLCTGFDTTKPNCQALAARSRKYFELWPGEKYLVKSGFSVDKSEGAG